MLRLASYDVVFQEIPGEVTLALNLSGCPNRCEGCHSPHLRGDIGETLDETLLDGLLRTYGSSVTCVCFMGGDADSAEVERLALRVKRHGGGTLKAGWYSGRQVFPAGCEYTSFDYVKLGPYIPECGGLRSEGTNQRMYRVDGGGVVDITESFRERR